MTVVRLSGSGAGGPGEGCEAASLAGDCQPEGHRLIHRQQVDSIDISYLAFAIRIDKSLAETVSVFAE